MKKTVEETKIHARMQAGVITYGGFLGTDKRHYTDIIEEDEQALIQLGITAEEIADRLEYFQQKSYDAFNSYVIVDEIFEVESEVVRGYLPCPFKHQGVYRKTYTTITNLKNRKSVTFSALNIHLIRDHHFFEGKGSHFRMNPKEVIEVIFENNH